MLALEPSPGAFKQPQKTIQRVEDDIRRVLRESGNLVVSIDAIGADEDLYEYGLTSHACVNVMLGLEDTFDFEFPDHLLRMTTFQSVRNIGEALLESGVTAQS
jgi:acyl carrier protein